MKRDCLVFDFNHKDNILGKVRNILNTKEMKAKMKNLDLMYDICGFAIFFLHLLVSFVGVYYDVFSPYLMVPFFVFTRTAMASMGHYHAHRRKDGFADWGDGLFDMQYVGASTVSFDGHVLGHHT
jgi:hypothetical protein